MLFKLLLVAILGFVGTSKNVFGQAEIQNVRLVDGYHSTNGRLEVFFDGVWGTVCDDGWDNDDATVVCRMLGYSSGIGNSKAQFGRGTGQIWLDDVRCIGTETSLLQCASANAGVHDCSHSEDAGVLCF